MYLLIVFLPLLSAIASGFFGRLLGREGSTRITTGCIATTFILSLIAFYEVALGDSPCYLELFTWIDSEMLHVSWGFLFDSLTVIMLIVVTSVSALVHLYSTDYMKEDPHVPRFMSYLSLFTFFMLILVTADNFVQMFVGWEGVGLCSYLLINFWFTRIQANKAAIKAIIINRIGDFGLSLGIFAIFFAFNAVDYSTVFSCAHTFQGKTFMFLGYDFDILTVICLLLFIGAVGKSAQIGLHTWLPDAMEGPTPVSALIHAATMVTAGVFLVARCSPIFEFAPTALLVVTFIGATTAFFAATVGLVQNDLKRVIAYSTCSQLGYMMFACGISNYSVGVFHLMNHAFFKALLFLSAGSVIHAMSDEQDMRKMGGLIQLIPFTYGMMLIGSLSLMGFPFLTGFYSKDVIIELAYAKYSIDGHFAHWFGCVSAMFTAFYSFRLIYLTFIAKPNAYKSVMQHVHDAPFNMGFPLVVLAFGSIFIGYLTKDMIIGLGTTFWGNSLFTSPANSIIIDSEFIDTSVKLIPLVLSLIGAGSAVLLNHLYPKFLYNIKLSPIGYKLYAFLNKRWYFDKVQNEFIGKNVMSFGYNVSYKIIDRGIVEVLGPLGITTTVKDLSKRASIFQTGYIYNYAFIMLVSITLLLFFIVSWNNSLIALDLRVLLLFLLIVVGLAD